MDAEQKFETAWYIHAIMDEIKGAFCAFLRRAVAVICWH
jgi:hypothetical protein